MLLPSRWLSAALLLLISSCIHAQQAAQFPQCDIPTDLVSECKTTSNAITISWLSPKKRQFSPGSSVKFQLTGFFDNAIMFVVPANNPGKRVGSFRGGPPFFGASPVSACAETTLVGVARLNPDSGKPIISWSASGATCEDHTLVILFVYNNEKQMAQYHMGCNANPTALTYPFKPNPSLALTYDLKVADKMTVAVGTNGGDTDPDGNLLISLPNNDIVTKPAAATPPASSTPPPSSAAPPASQSSAAVPAAQSSAAPPAALSSAAPPASQPSTTPTGNVANVVSSAAAPAVSSAAVATPPQSSAPAAALPASTSSATPPASASSPQALAAPPASQPASQVNPYAPQPVANAAGAIDFGCPNIANGSIITLVHTDEDMKSVSKCKNCIDKPEVISAAAVGNGVAPYGSRKEAWVIEVVDASKKWIRLRSFYARPGNPTLYLAVCPFTKVPNDAESNGVYTKMKTIAEISGDNANNGIWEVVKGSTACQLSLKNVGVSKYLGRCCTTKCPKSKTGDQPEVARGAQIEPQSTYKIAPWVAVWNSGCPNITNGSSVTLRACTDKTYVMRMDGVVKQPFDIPFSASGSSTTQPTMKEVAWQIKVLDAAKGTVQLINKCTVPENDKYLATCMSLKPTTFDGLYAKLKCPSEFKDDAEQALTTNWEWIPLEGRCRVTIRSLVNNKYLGVCPKGKCPADSTGLQPEVIMYGPEIKTESTFEVAAYKP